MAFKNHNIDTNKPTIKEWAEDDRPREKLLNKGSKSLSDAELLAILIRSGNRNKSALELGMGLLKNNENNLQILGSSSAQMIHKNGVGKVAAITIAAAIELGMRIKNEVSVSNNELRTSAKIASYIMAELCNIAHEEFWVLLLNNRLQLIAKRRISVGGITSTVVDIRLILKEALLNNAINIVLAHNHPSGNINPSQSDIDITKKIAEAAKMLDLKVCDHIIIAKNNYYSFFDNDQMR
jgi:DNA repair protein RadC